MRDVNQSLYDISRFKEALPHSFMTVTGYRMISATLHGKWNRSKLSLVLKGLAIVNSMEYEPEANVTKVQLQSLIKILKDTSCQPEKTEAKKVTFLNRWIKTFKSYFWKA